MDVRIFIMKDGQVEELPKERTIILTVDEDGQCWLEGVCSFRDMTNEYPACLGMSMRKCIEHLAGEMVEEGRMPPEDVEDFIEGGIVKYGMRFTRIFAESLKCEPDVSRIGDMDEPGGEGFNVTYDPDD